MGVNIKVVRVSALTGVGLQSITSSGFGTPKAAIFMIARDTATSGSSDGVGWSIGFADGTNQGCASVGAQHGVGTTNTSRRNSTSHCVAIVNGGGTIEAQATFNAWITDGIRITWGTAPSTAYRMYVILIGGDSVQAHVDSFASSNTIDADTDITDPGFEPNLILAAAVGTNFSTTADDHAMMELGAVHNDGTTVTQRCVTWYGRDGRGSGDSGCIKSTLYGLQATDRQGSATEEAVEFRDFDSSGFTVRTKLKASRTRAIYLALKISDADVKLFDIETPTSTGNDAFTDPGFVPQFVMMGMLGAKNDNTGYGNSNAGMFGCSVVEEGLTEHTIALADEEGSGTTDNESLTDDDSISLNDHDGTTMLRGTMSSFDSSGFTINWTSVDASKRNWWGLAIEQVLISSSAAADAPQATATPQFMHMKRMRA